MSRALAMRTLRVKVLYTDVKAFLSRETCPWKRKKSEDPINEGGKDVHEDQRGSQRR